jgi:hypothetical protein
VVPTVFPFPDQSEDLLSQVILVDRSMKAAVIEGPIDGELTGANDHNRGVGPSTANQPRCLLELKRAERVVKDDGVDVKLSWRIPQLSIVVDEGHTEGRHIEESVADG